MKKYVILVLCLVGWLYSQQTHTINTGALVNTSDNDSTFVASTTSGLTGVPVWRSTTTKDTIFTRWVLMEGLNADMSLEIRKVNVSGNDSVDYYVQCFRGIGTPDSTGYTSHHLVLSETDTTMSFYLPDSTTWWGERLFSRYRIAIYERDDQQNDYILNINQYSPTNKSVIFY